MQKPVAQLTGKDGNVFNLMGIASKALVRVGKQEEAAKMNERIHKEAESYAHALRIMSEYVEIK